MYTVAALPPGAGGGHPHHHNPYEVAALPTAQMQQLVVAQQAEEMRKNAKRAANRRSASTCRQRRKFLVENMADANDRMRKRARVLSLLPDMILAMRRDGVITYASENCSHFLQFTREVGREKQKRSTTNNNKKNPCVFFGSQVRMPHTFIRQADSRAWPLRDQIQVGRSPPPRPVCLLCAPPPPGRV